MPSGQSSGQGTVDANGALLNTIKLPRILRNLSERLPKPNYESTLTRRNSGSLPQAALDSDQSLVGNSSVRDSITHLRVANNQHLRKPISKSLL